MVSQKNGSSEPIGSSLGSDMSDFLKGVSTLVELQAQLFVTDVRECRQHGFFPGLILLCGVALGTGCFPVALVAIALLLIQVFEISSAAGFLIAVLAGTVLSGLLTMIGWFQVRKQMTVLQRSQQELVRNLRWLKKILVRDRLTRNQNGPNNSWRTKA
jgi:hypothetical protein